MLGPRSRSAINLQLLVTHRNRNVKDKQARSEEEDAREIKSQTPSTYLPTLARPLVLRPTFRTPLDSHPHWPPPPIAHRQSCVYRESAHKCKSRRTSRTKLASPSSRSGHSSDPRRSPCRLSRRTGASLARTSPGPSLTLHLGVPSASIPGRQQPPPPPPPTPPPSALSPRSSARGAAPEYHKTSDRLLDIRHLHRQPHISRLSSPYPVRAPAASRPIPNRTKPEDPPGRPSAVVENRHGKRNKTTPSSVIITASFTSPHLTSP